jgi:hypothetical protein
MPYQVSVDLNRSAVIARAFGTGTRNEGLQLLHESSELARAHAVKSVLIDILELDFLPTSNEAKEFASGLAQIASHGLRVAVVVPPGAAFGMARMVRTLTELLGVEVALFTSDEEAAVWLEVLT